MKIMMYPINTDIHIKRHEYQHLSRIILMLVIVYTIKSIEIEVFNIFPPNIYYARGSHPISDTQWNFHSSKQMAPEI